MKLLRFKRAGSLFLAIAFLALFLSVPALALSPTKGSITVDLTGSGGADASVSGIEFKVYRVADFLGDGNCRLTYDFSSSGVQPDQLKDASDASAASKKLAAYIADRKIGETFSGVTDSGGGVKFSGLSLGYYLVAQSENRGTQPSRIACDPFLIPVPMESADKQSRIYDIIAYPKCEEQRGAVILQKLNASDSPLSGAVFRLDERVSSGGASEWKTVISEITTNRNGQIAVTGMPFNDYRFVELRAPSGYQRNSTPQEFTVGKAGSVTLGTDGWYRAESGSAETIRVYNDRERHHRDSSDRESRPGTSAPSDVSDPSVPYAPPSSSSSGPEIIPEDDVPGSGGFNLPKTGGSIAYAVCTFGGIALILCGAAAFVISRKREE